MEFQHTTPMPSGISMMASTASIGVPQMMTAEGSSGTSQTIIPGDSADTLSINLLQLLITWGDVVSRGKFIISSKDSQPLTVYQDRKSGTIVLPCWSIIRYLGNHGLTIQNNSTGGEYSIVANYIVREL